MNSSLRLKFSAAIIVFSAVYAVLVSKDKQLASAIASGYVAILLTVITVCGLWKQP